MYRIPPNYYFIFGSSIFTIINIILSYFNIDFTLINIPYITIYFFILIICTFSVSGIFLKTLLVPFYKKKHLLMYDIDFTTSYIINYNLKAYNHADIDECFKNAFESFINNMTINSVAVIISVTEDETLQKYEELLLETYRNEVFTELHNQGKNFLNNPLQNIWWKNTNINYNTLEEFCKERAFHFILLRRNTMILKKCGQYQDLILLTKGYLEPYTYKDNNYYGKLTRICNQTFTYTHPDDFYRLYNINFEYTMVLDIDSVLSKNTLYNITAIANANPLFTIYQPRIELHMVETYFQLFQKLWLQFSNPTYEATCSYLNHSTFFGKGLIHNQRYIDQCIGSPNNLIEYVPINALSHDTFEAMCCPTLYCSDIVIFETPPKSFLAWNIRELRWNMGELTVAQHIFPTLLLRSKKNKYTRNKYYLSFKVFFFALSSFRVMITWPILLIFIGWNSLIPYKIFYLSYSYILITIIFIPTLINWKYTNANFKFALFYSISSFYNTLSEPIIGSLRLLFSCYNIYKKNLVWIPASKIDQLIYNKGNITSSIFYFGPFSLVSSIIYYYLNKNNYLLSILLINLICLPIYNFLTSLSYNKFSRITLKKINISK